MRRQGQHGGHDRDNMGQHGEQTGTTWGDRQGGSIEAQYGDSIGET